MAARYTVDDLRQRVGRELGVSDWFEVQQAMMDEFARSTNDHDKLHTSPEWAARETPYGGTIAFGFWTLSMLTHFSHEIGMWPVDAAYALNYGLDRVRWVQPVPVGSRIRMRCTLAGLEPPPALDGLSLVPRPRLQDDLAVFRRAEIAAQQRVRPFQQ